MRNMQNFMLTPNLKTVFNLYLSKVIYAQKLQVQCKEKQKFDLPAGMPRAYCTRKRGKAICFHRSTSALNWISLIIFRNTFLGKFLFIFKTLFSSRKNSFLFVEFQNLRNSKKKILFFPHAPVSILVISTVFSMTHLSHAPFPISQTWLSLARYRIKETTSKRAPFHWFSIQKRADSLYLVSESLFSIFTSISLLNFEPRTGLFRYFFYELLRVNMNKCIILLKFTIF